MYSEGKFSPLSKLALLLGLCGFGFIISGIITVAIAKLGINVPSDKMEVALKDPANINYIRWLQVLTTFFLMALPAFVFWQITSDKPMPKMGFISYISWKQFLFVGLMVFAGFMVGGALSGITELIPLPKQTETFFRKLETEYTDQVMLIASMKSSADFLISLILLALLPAIFEEMLFRGSLQQVAISVTGSSAAGIICTSIFFSAIHFSYYGFLPRLFLGVMLGYIFYYSKNLWFSIAAHFINNAWELFSIYMFAKQGGKPSEMPDENLPVYAGIIGTAAIIFLFAEYRKESRKVLSGCIGNISGE